MTPHMHGCALFPAPEHAAPLAAIRARFDPVHARKTVPHITLKQGFTGPIFDSVEEQALVAAVLGAASGFSSMRVELDRLESFSSPEYGGVVYARVVARPELSALAAAIVNAVAELGYATPAFPAEHENALFFPHLTLAQGLAPGAVEAMLSALSNWQPLQFRAHTVGLGRCDGEGVWRTPFTCRLDAATATESAADPAT